MDILDLARDNGQNLTAAIWRAILTAMSVRRFISRFLTKFVDDETTTLAASLAFYTALSLAPLAIIFVTVSARFSLELQTELISHLRTIMGEDAARLLAVVIRGAQARDDLMSTAGIVGGATLLVSAGLIFGQLRTALNRIFAVHGSSNRWPGWLGAVGQFLIDRLASIGMALISVLAMIISLVVSSVLSSSIHGHTRTWALPLNILISFLFYSGLFTIVFRYLPDRHQPWRRAAHGGVLTALLFEFGKDLLGVYLGRSAIGSAYGAAGSLIVLLVWVYYSTLITFIGAQVSSLWKSK